MAKLKLFLLVVTIVLLFSGSAALADEEGVDYGYWCTECGRQHGPGESCPASSSSGSSGQDEPYNFQEQAPELTPEQKSHKAAEETNAEGERLYNEGKYAEAALKFWNAMFSETSNPLYKENLEKANAAVERQNEEIRRQRAEKEKQAELERKLKGTGKKLKSVQPYGTSVVDATAPLKKSAPPQPKPTPRPVPTEQQVLDDMTYLLFLPEDKIKNDLSDQEMLDIIMGLEPKAKRRIFDRNPELPLINPLREPARYRAWEEECKKRLEAALNQKRYQALAQAMARDKELNAATDRIVKEEAKTVGKAQIKIWNDGVKTLNKLQDTTGLKNIQEFEKKKKSDPIFRQKVEVIADNYQKRSADNRANAKAKSFKEMEAERVKFFKRHPELKN